VTAANAAKAAAAMANLGWIIGNLRTRRTGAF
jgi:hypothetical protein